jgi:hypothetical protein
MSVLIVGSALWIAITAALIYAAVRVPDARTPLGERLSAAMSRRRRAPTSAPLGPPIEEIAANLRRLQAWLDRYDDPTPLPGKATKVAATLLAYDRVLADACLALEIRESLGETDGFEHEAERLRVQAALLDAGFVLAAPHRAGS